MCRDEPSASIGGSESGASGLGISRVGGGARRPAAANRDRDRRCLAVDYQQQVTNDNAAAADVTTAAKTTALFKQVSQVTKNRRRVAKMLLLLAILFVLCWTPYHIINVYIDFMPANLDANAVVITLLHYAILLGHVNSALNPILYCFLNNSFRQGAARLLHLKRKARGRRGDRRPVPPDSPQLPPPEGLLTERQRLFCFLTRHKDKNQQLQRHVDILR